MAKLALCIGINNYPGTGMDLSGCVNDAKDWGVALSKRGFEVKTLLDAKATLKGMREAMESVIAQAGSGDLVVLQYSGHGSYVPDDDGDEADGRDECLCPHDIETNGPIVDDDLFDIFSAAQRGVRIVMISDSCHSGSISKFQPLAALPIKRGLPLRKVRFMPPSTFLSRRNLLKLGFGQQIRSSGPPGRHAALTLAGCQDYEFSYDADFQGRPNGAFTFAALQSLAGLTARSTYGDWYKRIRKLLPSQQYPQTPNLYGSRTMKGWKVFT